MIEILVPSRGDAPRLSAFFRAAWHEAGSGALGWAGASDATMGEIGSESFLDALLVDKRTLVLAAVDTGDVIGIAVLRRIREAVDELAGIILLESRTGRGVGTLLLTEALERSRMRGAHEVIVQTEATNVRALGFYERFGFVVTTRGRETIEGTLVELVTLRRPMDRLEG